jgi:excisionase family DNA binding protein
MSAELLTVADVARITGFSAYTIRAAIRDGELAASKLRGQWRVHPDHLADWIDSGRAAATPGLDEALAVVSPQSSAPRRTTSGGSVRAAVRRRRAA